MKYQLTSSVKLSPSWEANSCSATQKIPRISQNPKAHYCNNKSLPLVSILSQINPIHTPPWPVSLRYSLISSHLHLDLFSGHFPSASPNKPLYASLFSPICATCCANLIVLDLINLIIFCEEYELWNSILCSFLQPSIISSLLGHWI
jgi:hypothetical protein